MIRVEYNIYHLPEENYVGVSGNVKMRIAGHKHKGKNVEGWYILAMSTNKKMAYRIEQMFQIEMNANGLVYRPGNPQYLTRTVPKPIDCYIKGGEFVKTYPSARQADQDLGLSYGCAGKVARGSQKSSGGFIFKFSKKYLKKD